MGCHGLESLIPLHTAVAAGPKYVIDAAVGPSRKNVQASAAWNPGKRKRRGKDGAAQDQPSMYARPLS